MSHIPSYPFGCRVQSHRLISLKSLVAGPHSEFSSTRLVDRASREIPSFHCRTRRFLSIQASSFLAACSCRPPPSHPKQPPHFLTEFPLSSLLSPAQSPPSQPAHSLCCTERGQLSVETISLWMPKKCRSVDAPLRPMATEPLWAFAGKKLRLHRLSNMTTGEGKR